MAVLVGPYRYTYLRIKGGETDAGAFPDRTRNVVQIEEDWKRDNILRLDSSNKLIADVALGKLREWVEMRRRLQGIAFYRANW